LANGKKKLQQRQSQ